MENLYLVVGLGNPGAEYALTRHNAGFLVVDRLLERWQAPAATNAKFNARVGRAEWSGRQVLLCEPQTYMNDSGEAVRSVADFYRIPVNRLVVVVDDADLPLGEIRLRPRGSSGGHHGLESIEAHLATRDYARLRVGIGRQTGGARRITGHVLGRFDASEMDLLGKALERAADQIERWLTAGLEKAMTEFNGVVKNPANESN